MSDSQSSEQVELKTELKMEAKLRDLLEKAKQITPSYDQDTLLLIYKDSFQNDTVFLNKLNIIAKNQKEAEDIEDQGWIHSKSHSKEKVQQKRPNIKQEERKKYNFLEDVALIQRARRFDPEKQEQKWAKRQEQHRERQESKVVQPPRQQFREKNEKKVESPTQQKKMKYKVKEEEIPQQKPAPKQDSPTKPRYQEKEVENKPKQVKEEKMTQTKEKQEVQPVIQKQPAFKNQDKEQIKKEKQVIFQPEPQEPKKSKIQYKLKEDKPKTQISNVPVPKAKQEPKIAQQQSSQEKISSPSKKVDLDPKVRQQFQLSCSQNTFILNFIPPKQRLQKVSYIREPNGLVKDVKVREVLPTK